MRLSIVIVNFNTVVITKNCLSSLLKHLPIDLQYEVIVIDNAPAFDYESEFKQVLPSLAYYRSENNIGFGRANNLGMTAARGEYYLLLNPDTIIFDESIQNCLSFMDDVQNSKIGLMGCKLLNEDHTYQASFYPFIRNNLFNYFISNNPLLNKLFAISKAYKEPTETREVGDVSGAFMLLRSEVYDKVNGFDPDFFLYCEETEWCRNRVNKHFRIVYYPEAAIVHLGGKSAPPGTMFIQAQLSLALYWYKTGIFNYCMFLIYSYLNGIFYLFQYPLSNAAGKSNIRKHLRSLYKIQKYLYFDIPRYSRNFNSRLEPLIVDEAKKVFFQDYRADQ